MGDISGRIKMADIEIEFDSGNDDGTIAYTVGALGYGRASMVVPQAAFLKALAIAVHNDGMPDHEIDYPDAESVQPKDARYRWIP
jgi:hypothetical protein